MTVRASPRGGALSLKGKALQYLSQREHSRLELARKLARWLAAQTGYAKTKTGPAAADLAVERALDSDIDRDQDCAAAEAIFVDAAVDQVLDQLAQAGLLSDARFTQSRLHQRQARFGNRRIEQELKQHGLAPTDNQRAELRSSEVQRATALLRSRLKPSASAANGSALEIAEIQKAQRFLAGRGFSFDAIRQALRQFGRKPTEDGP